MINDRFKFKQAWFDSEVARVGNSFEVVNNIASQAHEIMKDSDVYISDKDAISMVIFGGTPESANYVNKYIINRITSELYYIDDSDLVDCVINSVILSILHRHPCFEYDNLPAYLMARCRILTRKFLIEFGYEV